MQYILTEEEYKDLSILKNKHTSKHIKKLQEFCTLAAEHIPVKLYWTEDKKMEVWGCILSKNKNGRYGSYCDECPSQELCPNPHKAWSK